jgi:hypothetical protein
MFLKSAVMFLLNILYIVWRSLIANSTGFCSSLTSTRQAFKTFLSSSSYKIKHVIPLYINIRCNKYYLESIERIIVLEIGAGLNGMKITAGKEFISFLHRIIIARL